MQRQEEHEEQYTTRTCGQSVAWCLYNGALLLSWPALFLHYFLRSRTDGKYAGSFHARLGLELPARSAGTAPAVWFHALSAGETVSAVPLVKALKARRPGWRLLFSTATETGQAIAKERLAGEVDTFFYMPHDFPWAAGDLVRRLKPSLFVLVETDVWPNLLRAMAKNRIPSVLVNGRLSPSSFARMAAVKRLANIVLGLFSMIFTQSEADKTRFETLGAPPKRVIAAGNLKYASSLAGPGKSEVPVLGAAAGIDPGRPAWIAGSTHEGEEEILLDAHRSLRARVPDPLLVIAPRDIRRAAAISALCGRYGFDFSLRSKGESASGKAVLILDTLGELARFYALSDAAFIGGSFVPFGGHNPLEAAACGKFSLWGPHLFNFREIEADLVAAGCGKPVPSRAELESELYPLLTSPARRQAAQQAAEAFLASRMNPVLKIVEALVGAVR